jgi:hypothetical protein
MNPAVLTDRRKVFPNKSFPCSAPGWYLNFDTKGIAFLEPAFASIGKDPMFKDMPEVHGVIHEITSSEYEQIRRTEGGGGYADVGYQDQIVKVCLYDGNIIEAITLVEFNAKQIHDNGFPSQRYLKLLEDGAEYHKLDQSYLIFLRNLPRYIPNRTIWGSFCRFLYISLILTMAMPVFLPMAFCRLLNVRAPRVLYVAVSYAVSVAHFLYLTLFRPVLGNGAGEI